MKGLDGRTQCNLALASNIKSARLEWIGKARHASVIERSSEPRDHAQLPARIGAISPSGVG
jgi:hypothetical protein